MRPEGDFRHPDTLRADQLKELAHGTRSYNTNIWYIEAGDPAAPPSVARVFRAPRDWTKVLPALAVRAERNLTEAP